MGTHEGKYGIFVRNDMVSEFSKAQGLRTVRLGHICMIEGVLKNGLLHVRLLKDNETWESQTFITKTEECVLQIPPKLWQYIASIVSPQDRVKFARNKKLCDKLSLVCVDMVVGYSDLHDVKLGRVRYKGQIKGHGWGFGLELHVSLFLKSLLFNMLLNPSLKPYVDLITKLSFYISSILLQLHINK